MGPESTPRPKILIVDDNLDDLRWCRAILEHEGYDVDACNSYEEGAARASTGRYDFVLVDQGGPNFAGQEVVKQATEMNRHTPVLVVTRCLEMSAYLEAMQLGALDYLEMPVPAPFLLREIESHVRPVPA
jgi:two-component system sensor histidine kinase/response regulator